MRPDLNDLLSGVQRWISDEIIPALGESPYLREQASMACLVLEQCKSLWPRFHTVVAAEHTDLVQTVTRMSDQLAAISDSALLELSAEAHELVSSNHPTVGQRDLTEVLEQDRGLRQLISSAIRCLDRRERETGNARAPIPDAAAARSTIDGYLSRAAAREADLVSRLGLGW